MNFNLGIIYGHISLKPFHIWVRCGRSGKGIMIKDNNSVSLFSERCGAIKFNKFLNLKWRFIE